MLTRFVRLLKDDASFFNVFFTFDLMLFNIILLCVFIGSELISADLKFNALPLYFSRPLDRKDYILGKYSILVFYLLVFTWFPGMLLIVFKVIFTGSFSYNIVVLMAVFLFPLIVSVFFASLTLLISSFSSNRKFVWIAIFLIYIFSGALGEIMNGIFKNPYFFLFSIEVNVKQLGSFLFRTSPGFHLSPWISFVILVLSTLLMIFVLCRRIVKSEAQIESGG
jgi:ABC-2 type transport system permease protein